MTVLSPADAAALARVKVATLRKWVERGMLTRQPGGYDLAELLAAMDGRDGDALLSRAGIKIEDRPACRLRPP